MHMAFLSRVFKNLQWYGMTFLKALGGQAQLLCGLVHRHGKVFQTVMNVQSSDLVHLIFCKFAESQVYYFLHAFHMIS